MNTSKYDPLKHDLLIGATLDMLADRELITSDTPSARRKVAYLAVRLCGLLDDRQTLDSRRLFCQWTLYRLSAFTPRELLSLFPPDKVYDGERYQCKDYFSTMDAVSAHGPDKPLGDDALEFLFDYMNAHIRKFMVRFMMAMDEVCRANGILGPMDWCLSEMDLTTHTLFTAGGKQYLRNDQTGSCIRVTEPRKRAPRWWKIIEGGTGA